MVELSPTMPASEEKATTKFIIFMSSSLLN